MWPKKGRMVTADVHNVAYALCQNIERKNTLVIKLIESHLRMNLVLVWFLEGKKKNPGSNLLV